MSMPATFERQAFGSAAVKQEGVLLPVLVKE